MSIAKISYWEFPGPGRQILNLQTFGSDELVKIEIPHEQYKRLLMMGFEMYMRESFSPVPNPNEVVEP